MIEYLNCYRNCGNHIVNAKHECAKFGQFNLRQHHSTCSTSFTQHKRMPSKAHCKLLNKIIHNVCGVVHCGRNINKPHVMSRLWVSMYIEYSNCTRSCTLHFYLFLSGNLKHITTKTRHGYQGVALLLISWKTKWKTTTTQSTMFVWLTVETKKLMFTPKIFAIIKFHVKYPLKWNATAIKICTIYHACLHWSAGCYT